MSTDSIYRNVKAFHNVRFGGRIFRVSIHCIIRHATQ